MKKLVLAIAVSLVSFVATAQNTSDDKLQSCRNQLHAGSKLRKYPINSSRALPSV